MNHEPDKLTIDRQVSDTYRELANERVPEQLNDAVLRKAANEKAPWSIIPGLWMKPIAWAATIGLSLAIVMELTQTPSISPDMNNNPPLVSADEAEMLAPAHLDAATESATDDRRERAVQAGESAVVEPPPASGQREPEQKRRDLKPAVHRAAKPVTEKAAAQAMNLAPGSAADAAMEEGQATTDVDSSASKHAGDTPAPSSLAVTAEELRMTASSLCPEAVRDSAEEWYRCIEEKRATSAAEAINDEIEALRRRFPDYPVPDANR